MNFRKIRWFFLQCELTQQLNINVFREFFPRKTFQKVSHDELGQISCKITVIITTIEIPRNPPP